MKFHYVKLEKGSHASKGMKRTSFVYTWGITTNRVRKELKEFLKQINFRNITVRM